MHTGSGNSDAGDGMDELTVRERPTRLQRKKMHQSLPAAAVSACVLGLVFLTVLYGFALDSDGQSVPVGSSDSAALTDAVGPTFPVTVGPGLTHNGGRNALMAKVADICDPPTAVASGGGTIDPGGSVALSGSGGVSCSWSPVTGLDDPSSCSPIASPFATTSYSLTVVDDQGCASTNETSVAVAWVPR